MARISSGARLKGSDTMRGGQGGSGGRLADGGGGQAAAGVQDAPRLLGGQGRPAQDKGMHSNPMTQDPTIHLVTMGLSECWHSDGPQHTVMAHQPPLRRDRIICKGPGRAPRAKGKGPRDSRAQGSTLRRT